MKTEEQDQIRRAIADVLYAGGCGCCADRDAQHAAEERLAKLLSIEPFDDGSGYDFSQYRTPKDMPVGTRITVNLEGGHFKMTPPEGFSPMVGRPRNPPSEDAE